MGQHTPEYMKAQIADWCVVMKMSEPEIVSEIVKAIGFCHGEEGGDLLAGLTDEELEKVYVQFEVTEADSRIEPAALFPAYL